MTTEYGYTGYGVGAALMVAGGWFVGGVAAMTLPWGNSPPPVAWMGVLGGCLTMFFGMLTFKASEGWYQTRM